MGKTQNGRVKKTQLDRGEQLIGWGEVIPWGRLLGVKRPACDIGPKDGADEDDAGPGLAYWQMVQ